MNRYNNTITISTLLAVLLWGCSSESAAPKSITVVSYGGGSYQESQKRALFDPYSQSTKINVEPVVWNAEYVKLKEMVDQKSVPWDVVEVTDALYRRGLKDGLFEKIAWRNRPAGYDGTHISDNGIADLYWATVLTYDPKKFKAPPTSIRDFWDLKGFPGARALYDDPRCNLEFALLADGVSIDKLYPLDVDRAFRKLDQIKHSIRLWWTDGTQPLQLLASGGIALTTTWNGRAYDARRKGQSVAMVWNGAALDLDWWVIPKGAKNVALSSEFIEFVSAAERVANQASEIGYGPACRDALALIPTDVQSQLPTAPDNWKQAFRVDSAWWSENEERVKKKWDAWKGGN